MRRHARVGVAHDRGFEFNDPTAAEHLLVSGVLSEQPDRFESRHQLRRNSLRLRSYQELQRLCSVVPIRYAKANADTLLNIGNSR